MEKNIKEISIKIEGKEWQDAQDKAYEKAVKEVKIDGFRKGKAPYKIVEKQYGAQIFYEDAFNEVVPEIYEKE